MMSVTSTPASLAQALMSADTAAAPEQPATNAAQFAALIAGVGMMPKGGDADAAIVTEDGPSEDAPDDDLVGDDGAGAEQDPGEGDPLAAALAMLPVAMQQAVIAPLGQAGNPTHEETQPMPTISAASSDKLLQGKIAAETRTSNDGGLETATPPVLSDAERRALGTALAARASTSLGGNGEAKSGIEPGQPPVQQGKMRAVTAQATDRQPLTEPAAAQAQRMLPPLVADGSRAEVVELPKRAGKRDPGDAGVTASSSADQLGTQPAPAAHIANASSDLSGSQPLKTEGQAPLDQALAHQHLDISSNGQWLDQLARDIATSASPEGKLSFHLNPEHLGSLHVEVMRGAEGASVRLTADTDAARTLLIDARPRLEAEARAQGVKITETHVDLGGQGAGQGALGQGTRQQAQAQPEPLLRTIGARGGSTAAGTTKSSAAAVAAAERYA